MFAAEQTADNAFRVAGTLRNLFQYKKSVLWYEKTLELDPNDIETMGTLAYVYSQCEEYQKAIQMAEKLLKCDRISEPDFRDEVYCMLADANYFEGDITKAISWQERILSESKNKELIAHTHKIKKQWMDQQ